MRREHQRRDNEHCSARCLTGFEFIAQNRIGGSGSASGHRAIIGGMFVPVHAPCHCRHTGGSGAGHSRNRALLRSRRSALAIVGRRARGSPAWTRSESVRRSSSLSVRGAVASQLVELIVITTPALDRTRGAWNCRRGALADHETIRIAGEAAGNQEALMRPCYLEQSTPGPANPRGSRATLRMSYSLPMLVDVSLSGCHCARSSRTA